MRVEIHALEPYRAAGSGATAPGEGLPGRIQRAAPRDAPPEPQEAAGAEPSNGPDRSSAASLALTRNHCFLPVLPLLSVGSASDADPHIAQAPRSLTIHAVLHRAGGLPSAAAGKLDETEAPVRDLLVRFPELPRRLRPPPHGLQASG